MFEITTRDEREVEVAYLLIAVSDNTACARCILDRVELAAFMSVYGVVELFLVPFDDIDPVLALQGRDLVQDLIFAHISF